MKCMENSWKKIEEYGVRLVDFSKITEEENKFLEAYFDMEISGLISPTIVGKRQPFPFLKNKEIYAVVVLTTKSEKKNAWGLYRVEAVYLNG